MKKIILFILFVFALTTATEAQTRKEKIQAMRQQVFIEELQLSEQEVDRFFPVYEAYEAEREALQKKIRRARRQIELVADEDIKAHINKLFDLEEAQIVLKRKYVDRFMEVLSTRKAIYIYRAEQAFKKRLLEKMRTGSE
ncbi:MAG: hypothetical protein AAGI49_05825 [Bacteroidota bacterium]